MSKAFSRSLAIAAAVAHAISLIGNARDFALANIPEYKSRGKGMDKFSGLATNHRQTTFDVSVGGGKREVARRKSQIERGILQVSGSV